MSSVGNEGRSYEMDDVNVVVVVSGELDDGPMSFKDNIMFKSVLKAYDDERKWWDAVENFLKNENEDLAAKVRAKTHTGGRKLRQQAIVQLMVDLLLNMEAITESQGLVYVVEELESYPLKFLAIELLKRGANVEAKDDHGCTPFLKAVKHDAPECLLDLLLERGANAHAVADDRKTALHFAAQKDKAKIIRQMINKGLSVNAVDKDGWTPLHEAAYYGSRDAVAVLIKNGAAVNAKDHKMQTPLHVAAMKGKLRVMKFLMEKGAYAMAEDLDGNTPVDIVLTQSEHVDIENDSSVKRRLEDLMTSGSNISDYEVRERIWELSPSSALEMFRPECCGGEEKFNFLQQFVQNPMLKKSTMAILDQFVVGNGQHKMVFCEVIDADMDGIPPDDDSFNASSPCLLDVIVESDNKELAQHPAIRAILDYKWKRFARWIYTMFLIVYAVQMLFFGLALLIAARPGLDNPGCYRDGWDLFRGICEGMAFIFFLGVLLLAITNLLSLSKSYLKNNCLKVFLGLLPMILPLLIIPFRAATTWCASTGDGYCVDPTLLHNTSNATSSILDINQACITASSIQWIIASLAYMANASLVVRYLRPLRSVSIYVRALNEIIAQDLCTFSAIFLVVLYIFVGSFYLALRAGVYVDMSTGAITSDVEQFSLQTLYPWHVMFTGLRSLVEARGVLDGKYFANDDNGQYIGYQWFSVVMYMTFLFTVIVVLLNVLIAQMSHTYSKLQENNDGTFNIIRAKDISYVQKIFPIPFRWTTFWQHHYKRVVWTEYTDEEQKQYWIRKTERARFVGMEQKNIDIRNKMRDELTQQLQQQERLMEEKVDQLTEMTAELTRRFQVWEKRWSFEMGAQ